jgi:hypothetical protein
MRNPRGILISLEGLNTHMFRRYIRNEEQPLIPPVKNNNENNLVEDLGDGEFA